MFQWIQQQISFVAVRIYATNKAELPLGTVMLVSQDQVEGHYPVYESEIIAQAREILQQGYTISQQINYENLQLKVCFDVQLVTPAMIIVGAGHIAVPLSQMAKILGFSLTILDDRPDYANHERFPNADEILVGPFEERLQKIPLHSQSYVVLITRGHAYDRECLRAVLGRGAAYIGMICSLRRKASTFGLLQQEGYSSEQLQEIYAPIGLDIGGETPEEIAVSIISEIVALRNQGAEWVRNHKKEK